MRILSFQEFECSNLSTGSATLLLAVNSVVYPDPVGFETPHPDTDPEKNHSVSEQLWIRIEFEVKLL
jgi:hypothetical protein